MCGIAGIINLNSNQRIDAERLRRMRDVLHHRGPDGDWTGEIYNHPELKPELEARDHHYRNRNGQPSGLVLLQRGTLKF